MSMHSNFVRNVLAKNPTFTNDSLHKHDIFLSFRDEVVVLLMNVPYSRLQDKEKVGTLLKWIKTAASKCHKEKLNFKGKDKAKLVNV